MVSSRQLLLAIFVLIVSATTSAQTNFSTGRALDGGILEEGETDPNWDFEIVGGATITARRQLPCNNFASDLATPGRWIMGLNGCAGNFVAGQKRLSRTISVASATQVLSFRIHTNSSLTQVVVNNRDVTSRGSGPGTINSPYTLVVGDGDLIFPNGGGSVDIEIEFSQAALGPLAALVELVLSPPPPPFVANDDSPDPIDEDTSIVVPVTQNDSGNISFIELVADPISGNALVSGNNVNYVPNANYFGSDSFEYRICAQAPCEAGAEQTATVTLQVAPVNDLPLALDDSLTLAANDTTGSIDVSENDSDVEGSDLTFQLDNQNPAANGSVSLSGSIFSYQVDDGFSGVDAFGYLACDNDGCSPALVNVQVLAGVCGNRVIESGEDCDDGTDNGDGPDQCRPNCRVPTCGDGVVDSDEDCDDPNGNQNVSNVCRTDCTAPFCGDGIIDIPAESCDEGSNNSDSIADRCRTDCRPAFCGDGVQDSDEGCDTAELRSDANADACRINCQPASCGDGTIDTGEACDSGAQNSLSPDACRPTCVIPSCGDQIVDTGEQCDLGANNGDGAVCNDACRSDQDGDGIIDDDENVDCLDLQNPDSDGDGLPDGAPGETAPCDPCVPDTNNAVCSGNCGDRVLDAPLEECDNGADNNDSAADACRTNCRSATCGDGVQDSAEECDDGAGNSDDIPNACRLLCTLPTCGDNVLDNFLEECEIGMPGCNDQCELSRCGDGVVDSDEECDPGDENFSNTAPNGCREGCIEASCGDGVIDEGETCDDGDLNSDVVADACRNTCLPALCGDGVVDPPEECDNGLENDDDAFGVGVCRTSCALPFCGDGATDIDGGEECDDGEGNFGNAPGQCRVGCIAPFCGDGILDDDEECDRGADNSNSPNLCRNTCELPRCGDGILDGDTESCDTAADQNANNIPDGEDGSCPLDCAPPDAPPPPPTDDRPLDEFRVFPSCEQIPAQPLWIFALGLCAWCRRNRVKRWGSLR